MFNIIPVSQPNAQNLEPPLPAITLHLGDHATHHARSCGVKERPAVVIPQRTLVPELEGAVDEGRFIVVEIMDDEMLLSTGFLVSPGAGDAGVEL